MLQFIVEHITEQGLMLDQRVAADTLSLLDSVAHTGEVSFIQPIHVRLRATIVDETVLITGSAATAVRIACSRCLDPFDLKIDTDISVTAVPHMPPAPAAHADDAIELTADEMEVMTYSGEYIELGEEVAQQIIMALPIKPLCRDTCKGLCSRCGVDLNQTSCQCASRDKASPFAVLKTLSFPKQEE